MYSVDKILKRLNTSYIDNYFLHWPDRLQIILEESIINQKVILFI